MSTLSLERIRYENNQRHWIVVDDNGEPDEEIQAWLNHLYVTNMSPNTIEAYARHLVRFANYLKLNKQSLRTVTVAIYDDYLKWLSWTLSQDQNIDFSSAKLLPIASGPNKLSSSMQNQINLAVKSYYRYLTGQVDFNIFSSEKSKAFDGIYRYKAFLEHINKRKASRSRDSYQSGDIHKIRKHVATKRLTPENILALISACKLMRDALLIVFLYNTGMRIGEALGLRITDIDIDNNVIWVVPRADNENGARAKSGKTRGIPVLDYVLDMYEAYITSEEFEQAFESGSNYVFCNVNAGKIGKAMSFSNVQRLNKALVRRTNVDFSWHLFRHTHASEIVADGYSLLETANRLGHSSPQTTHDFYKHLYSSEIMRLQLTNPEKIKNKLSELQNIMIKKGEWQWI